MWGAEPDGVGLRWLSMIRKTDWLSGLRSLMNFEPAGTEVSVRSRKKTWRHHGHQSTTGPNTPSHLFYSDTNTTNSNYSTTKKEAEVTVYFLFFGLVKMKPEPTETLRNQTRTTWRPDDTRNSPDHSSLYSHHDVVTTDLNTAAVRPCAFCSSVVLVLHCPAGLLCVLGLVWILSSDLFRLTHKSVTWRGSPVPPTALIGS